MGPSKKDEQVQLGLTRKAALGLAARVKAPESYTQVRKALAFLGG